MTYTEFLIAYNLTQEMMEKTLQIPTLNILMGNVKILSSGIQGLGLFSKKLFLPDNFICSTVLNNKRTLGGRYANHSSTPNAYGSGFNGFYCLIAKHKIISDEEITINYSQIVNLFIKNSKEVLCLG